jgi:glycosyltransferase involved in cell wall biosynthesis
MSELLVSAIIPAYRRPEKLRKAVESLLSQDIGQDQYEIIVVDSSPDSANAEIMEALQTIAACSLRFFRKKPEGPGPSRNLGAKEARGKFLAFMDSDCIASSNWLREAVAAFQNGDGLVQGKTIPEPGKPHSIFNYYITVENESFLYEACNILYRREAFEQAGGFLPDMDPHDERPRGGEDVDLAWKVKRLGWNSRFAANAVIMHEVVRIGPRQWLINKRLYIIPAILRKFPELRKFFFARYFYEKNQAYLSMALAGIMFAFLHPLALLLTVPYVVSRASEPTRSLSGPLRLLRVGVYLLRDMVSFSLLLAGSVRYRTILL